MQDTSPPNRASPASPQQVVFLSATDPQTAIHANHLVIHADVTFAQDTPTKLQVLIDCGATACFISSRTARKFAATLTPLKTPAALRLIDNSPASAGPITHTTAPTIQFNAHSCSPTCYVTDIGGYDIILGRPWLNAFNPDIDWPTGSISFPTVNPPAAMLDDASLPLELICSATAPDPLGDDSSVEDIDDLADPFPGLSSVDSPEYLSSLREIIPADYHDLIPAFSKAATNVLPPHREHFDHHITVPDNIVPPASHVYHLSVPKLAALKAWLEELLSKGFIRRSTSPYSAPVLLVNKPDPSSPAPSYRPCIDYRMLNWHTEKDRTPLPLISETFDRLASAAIYTKLDLRGAFNLNRVAPGHEKYTAFCTRYGLFECLVMPFGLTNAPATFQRLMNSIFHDLLDVTVAVFLDDITIFSDSVEDHPRHVREVLQRLIDNQLYVKAEKCQFSVTSMLFLGHIVSTAGLSMDPARVSALSSWPEPTSIRDVLRFLGFANAYRRYIPDYAALTAPLTELTTKRYAKLPFLLTPAASNAFAQLKQAFTSTPLLRHFDPSLPTLIETDSSGYAIAAVLSQTHTYDSTTHQHPVAFFSRKLTTSEKNYAIHEKELLAVVAAVRWWKEYLESCASPFEVLTDHQTLQYFQQSQTLNQRQLRWSVDINHHKYVIRYRPARFNKKADFLSRHPEWEIEANLSPPVINPILRSIIPPTPSHSPTLTLAANNTPRQTRSTRQTRQTPYITELTDNPSNLDTSQTPTSQTPPALDTANTSSPTSSTTPTSPTSSALDTAHASSPTPSIAQLITDALPHDSLIFPLLHLLLDTSLPRTKQQKSTLKDFTASDPLSVLHKGRRYIPPNDVLRAHILSLAHDDLSAGHFGREKTLELVRRTYSWPGLSSYVETYVASCDICQHAKVSHRRPLGLLKPLNIPLRPWSSISWDHITELPPSSGHDAILVIVDRLTKLAHFVPAKTTDSATTLAGQFIEHVYRQHGLPSNIVSDRGATFASAWWREVTRILGTQTALSTAFHPQTDGQTERTNQTVEHYMRCFCDYRQSNWSDLLPLAEFAYNNSFHSAIGMSPFFATYGYHPDALLSSASVDPAASPIPNAAVYATQLSEIHALARAMIKEASDKYSFYANKRRREHDPNDYQPGTLVMVNRRNIASTRPTVKFDNKLVGPFPIVSAVGSHAYRLDIGRSKIHNVFHVDLLHLYTPPSTIPGRPVYDRPGPEIPEENAYVVEKIIDSRIFRGKLEYLCRWLKWEPHHDSWVPHTEFHADDAVVLDFYQAHPDRPKVTDERAPLRRKKAGKRNRTESS